MSVQIIYSMFSLLHQNVLHVKVVIQQSTSFCCEKTPCWQNNEIFVSTKLLGLFNLAGDCIMIYSSVIKDQRQIDASRCHIAVSKWMSAMQPWLYIVQEMT